MTLEEFNSKYKYQSDKEKYKTNFDIWEKPKLNKDGFYYGDCESYCRFLKENIEKFEEWDYYYCKLNGEGHCVLSNGALIIDCNIKQPILKDKYFQMFNITDFKKYNKFLVISKNIFADIFTFFKR